VSLSICIVNRNLFKTPLIFLHVPAIQTTLIRKFANGFSLRFVANKPLSSTTPDTSLASSLVNSTKIKVGQAIQKHCHLVRAVDVDVRLCFRGGEMGKGPRIRKVPFKL
jgi:hypothetical protein